MTNLTKMKIPKKYEDRVRHLGKLDDSYELVFADGWMSSWGEKQVFCNCQADVRAFISTAKREAGF